MSNKNCPSYDCGYCNTFPTPYTVKCGDELTKNCKWLNFDFKKISFEQFMKNKDKDVFS